MFRTLLIVLWMTLGLYAGDTVVILLRHAEKTHKGDAALLSEAGHRRAASLPAQLGPYQPVALFASNLQRTQQTLAPISKALAIPIQIYDRGTEGALGTHLLARYKGRTVLVCGHSDTLALLMESLGCPAPFTEVSGFDHYWVLRVSEASGAVALQELRQAPVPGQALAPPPESRK